MVAAREVKPSCVFAVSDPGMGKAREVALHVRQEDRHPRGGEAFGEDLERDRLAGAGRARDQPVAVGVLEEKLLRFRVAFAPAAHEDRIRAHPSPLLENAFDRRSKYSVNHPVPV